MNNIWNVMQKSRIQITKHILNFHYPYDDQDILT